MKRALFLLMKLACILVLVLVLVYIALRWFERNSIWIPRRELVSTPDSVGLTYQDVTFETSDGVKLTGWYIKHDHPVATLLFCHGNAGNISYRLESFRQFHSIRLDTFIFDYRGYGASDGDLSEEGTYLDARAAYEWLLKQQPQRPLIIFGRSLGAAVATDLASQVECDGVIIESGFTSCPDLGEELYPFLPVRRVGVIVYESIKRVPNIKAPVLVVHSKDDELIPFHHGEKLYAAAPEPKRFLEIEGNHNDGHLFSEEAYLAGLRDFLVSLGADYGE